MTRARKRFGQNFLVREDMVARVIDEIDPRPGERVVEIGPGRGALTGPLLAHGVNLSVVEIDRDLAEYIRGRYPELHVVEDDALQVDLASLLGAAEKVRLVGNLPYNVATPLIFRLFDVWERVSDMTFMLQREVAERLVAGPGDAGYGRLSVMAHYYARAEMRMEVPPEAFEPRPKVISALVRLTPAEHRPSVDPIRLGGVVAAAFSARRKTLRNALRGHVSEEELAALGLDPGLRPENLDLDDYVRIAQTLDAAGRP